MRIRSRLPSGVQLDMTPMIDIVFQLLVFFAMTLRVAEVEGDLAMLPPAGESSAGPGRDAALPLRISLRADEHGALRAVELNGRPLASISALNAEVERLIGDDAAIAAATEAYLACDESLAYEHAVAAITAVTGTRLANGEIKPLAGEVRFAGAR